VNEEEQDSEHAPGRGWHAREVFDVHAVSQMLGEDEHNRDGTQEIEIGGEGAFRGIHRAMAFGEV